MTVCSEDIKALEDRHKSLTAEVERLGAELQRIKAGGEEWPEPGDTFCHIAGNGEIPKTVCSSERLIEAFKRRGNCYRTEREAKAADDQIQFLRRAMTAGDLAPGKLGFGLSLYDDGRVSKLKGEIVFGFRKFSTIEARDAFIKSEGGIEVFRAKLAKGWPV